MATEMIKNSSSLLGSHNGGEAETQEMFIKLASTKIVFFITIAHIFRSVIMGIFEMSFFLYHWRYFDLILQKCSLIVPNVTYEFCPNC